MQMVGLPQCQYGKPALSRFDMGSINPAIGLVTHLALVPSASAIENPTHLPGEEPGEAPPALAPAARNDMPHFVNIPAQCEKTMGVVSVTADAVGVNKDISGTYQHKYQSNPKSRINPSRAIDPNQSQVPHQGLHGVVVPLPAYLGKSGEEARKDSSSSPAPAPEIILIFWVSSLLTVIM